MNRKAYNKLIFELSKKGRSGYKVNQNPFDSQDYQLPSHLIREKLPELPEVDEPTIVRHYTNMSTNNFGVDTGFYPLGSCTMKYNPKINEEIVNNDNVCNTHPYQAESTLQGSLQLYHTLQSYLSEIGGMSEFTLNPYAGAHGELTGLLIIKAFHDANGDKKRTKVIVPDSAHGTNPARLRLRGMKL